MRFTINLSWSMLFSALIFTSCHDTSFKPGTFGYDLDFLKKHDPTLLVLSGPDNKQQVAISGKYQGRIMTSTAEGPYGSSYGWINYDLLAKDTVLPHMTPVGGEERFWLGPEGGPFALYFPPGVPYEFQHWQVPPAIDTEPFRLVTSDSASATFQRDMDLTNHQGTTLKIGVERTIRLLSRQDGQQALSMEIPPELEYVGISSENTITNRGQNAWDSLSGMPSIWILSMLKPGPKTTVGIPLANTQDRVNINDAYFGKIPADRLRIKGQMVYFKADGLARGKIGIPPRHATSVAASYDELEKVLTIAQITLPKSQAPYVNSQWADQPDPFNGDVINAYNDGTLDDGSQLGPFYEIESSSPAAQLKPGENLTHIHRTFHFKGSAVYLDKVALFLLGIKIEDFLRAWE